VCFKAQQEASTQPAGEYSPQAPCDKLRRELTHQDKVYSYIQTSGQLFGALGLVASGLLEGNIPRAALGGINSLRSSFKLAADLRAKSHSKSHRNDVAEGGFATSANSVGFLNVRSPEELIAVTLGVTAWATKTMTAFIHKRGADKSLQEHAEIDSNNKFFAERKVTPRENGSAVKVVGFVYKNIGWLKDKAMEGTLAIMSHAPPLMMGARAVSYLLDGVNNNDMAMAGGGAAFIVGSVLMAVKDHSSYMNAKIRRAEKRSLKEKMASDFDNAERGEGLSAVVEISADGKKSVGWGESQLSAVTINGVSVERGDEQNAEENKGKGSSASGPV
tara:strand:+ start:145063 stop:146058 length:996 start_codon:yes stop_codon:yes gene_type:complete